MESINDIYPWWTAGLTPLMAACVAGVLSLVATWFCCAVAIFFAGREAQGVQITSLPWMEKNRLLYPFKIVSLLSFGFPVAADTFLTLFDHHPQSTFSGGSYTSVNIFVGVLCVGAVKARYHRQLGLAGTTVLGLLRDAIVLGLLVFPQLLIGYIALVPFNERGWLIAFFVLAIAILSSAYNMIVLRLCGLAYKAGPEVDSHIRRAAELVGVNPKRVYILRSNMANAFALPFDNSVGMTDTAIRVLNGDEQTAVWAHELAHLSEPPTVKAQRFFANMALCLSPAVMVLEAPFLVLLPIAMGFFFVYSIIQRLLQKMEVRADGMATEVLGRAVYAKALAAMHEHNHIPAVMPGQLQTHPHFYDRLVSMGYDPGQPRPNAPKAGLQMVAFAMTAALVVATSALFYVSIPRCNNIHLTDPEVCLALLPGDHNLFARLGNGYYEKGNLDVALAYYQAAHDDELEHTSYALWVIHLLLELERCSEASAAHEQLEKQLGKTELVQDEGVIREDIEKRLEQCRP